MAEQTAINHGDEIAIIGVACRFPGAKTLDEYGQYLCAGKEFIEFLSDEDLLASGVDPVLLARPDYVRATSRLENLDMFDAAFFGYAPKDAEIMDPQHRLFLECAWEALENAGYDAERYKGWIGVYGGAGNNLYRWHNLASHPGLIDQIGALQVALQNEKDFLTTRVSYKLNLHGPAVTVQTACSTSLVAVHLACQSLLAGECNMALAGGVSIDTTPKQGYLYREGGVASPDGHCRAFDRKAKGSIGGSGAGIVVLKLLEEALADGDFIHAVIKGSAINNDGSYKVGFTAPSVECQAEVITEALAAARVDAQSISYVETHGSGTPLGDPIEIAALTQAFRRRSQASKFCAIGSVKTNLGHLDTAAGIAGLLKVVQALKQHKLPPHLHFEEPNPAIDFENSPFFVNTRLVDWQTGPTPRRAGVSSFGMGGTNAHAILEEAPSPAPSVRARSPYVLVLSARTGSALETMTNNLITHLRQNEDQAFSDVVYTHQVGRRAFAHRRMLVCQDSEDAIQALETHQTRRVFTSVQPPSGRPLAFLFPGLGDHYVNMGLELYEREEVFQTWVEQCATLLKPLLGIDLREVLYPERRKQQQARDANLAEYQIDLRAMLRAKNAPVDEYTQKLHSTLFSQISLFVAEYSLARLWLFWGISPQALAGYSLGEYVAACLAGVFSLEDALTLIVKRAQLIETLPEGAMLAVSLPSEEVEPLLSEKLSIAIIGSPVLCVVSGELGEIALLADRLTEMGIIHKRLQVSHAFHSSMMDPIVAPFTQVVQSFRLHPPQVPFLSNVTGTWITPSEATDPGYWAGHLREPVHFAAALHELWQEPARILLEVGPGRTLCGLALQCISEDSGSNQVALSSLPASFDSQPEVAHMLTSLGKLWLAGVEIDWPALYGSERPRRVPVPTYPFERQRYWIEPYGHIGQNAGQSSEPLIDDELSYTLASSPHARPDLFNAYVAPRTEIERTVADIYGELLGLEHVGIHDNFFELGGDSLLAMRLVSHLREAFQANISQRSVFEAATIAGLSEIILQNPTEQMNDEEMGQWLSETESLSEEEVRTLIDAQE